MTLLGALINVACQTCPMARRNLNDLLAFVTFARDGSFTRAASVLGVTPSALSQALKALEERLEIRLLTRTTRSVSPTQAGERLLAAIGNRFDEIEAELDALTALRDKPAGTVRLTSGDFPLRTLLLPRLMPLMHRYPDINIEFDVSYGLRDIVADRFDAGSRRLPGRRRRTPGPAADPGTRPVPAPRL